ncbi:aspartate/methionine/tyrosine aminotransferase [Streptosporangium lutulentum]|uniref:Aminotransferase n=1 Tax=Streptosporangium lutulentum TaxID=1461250 RepID=A0ABT9QVT8_9ACTN|nr:pyridoxal phosphate-dependent aminotransferase [Streptosporangium lutulentum]MDP9850413.1 aspartate/methionine/tyrosine aminotransferase [Streptosporangium lutulentum]
MNDPFFARSLAQLTGPGSGYARTTTTAGSEIDLGTGEVRYPLPAEVRADLAAAIGGMDEPWYGDPAGQKTLRAAYLRHLLGPAANQAQDIGRVLVTGGGKEACWLAVRYLLQSDGNGTLVPRPGWEPYGLWVNAADRQQLPYDPAELAADPAVLRRLAGDAPSWPALLVLNYPHNPTGVHVDQPTMDAIIETAADLGLAVVSDEVYRAFAPGHVSAALAPAYDPLRHLIIDSTSKWLAAAGLRVGFLVADPSVIGDLTAFRASYASMTSAIAQQAAATLLTSPTATRWLATIRTDVDGTRRATAEHLADLGISVTSHGALYLWCANPGPANLPPTAALAGRAKIADGSGFGAPGHVRICPARDGLDPATAAAAVANTLRSR